MIFLLLILHALGLLFRKPVLCCPNGGGVNKRISQAMAESDCEDHQGKAAVDGEVCQGNWHTEAWMTKTVSISE